MKYAFSRRTRWSSLLYAAAAAQYALLVKPYNAEKSAAYRKLAERAYAYGNDPDHSLGEVTIAARKNRGHGAPYTQVWEEKDAMIRPFLLQARARLYLLTGDTAYLADLPQLAADAPDPYKYPNTFNSYSAWMCFDVPRQLTAKLPAEIIALWRGRYVEAGSARAAMNDAMPYRCSWPRAQENGLGWGASTMTNYSRAELIAWALSGQTALREAAIQNADFAFGANPLGMCWTTGLGYVYPVDIQHAVSEDDGILDPVPGITIYGMTGGAYPQLRNEVWRAPTGRDRTTYTDFMAKANQDRPVFRQFSVHPHVNTAQCEFTIHETMSSTILTCALLMPRGWKPGPALTQRQPRPAPWLFGYYYLP